jgi:hypothetical protein
VIFEIVNLKNVSGYDDVLMCLRNVEIRMKVDLWMSRKRQIIIILVFDIFRYENDNNKDEMILYKMRYIFCDLEYFKHLKLRLMLVLYF